MTGCKLFMPSTLIVEVPLHSPLNISLMRIGSGGKFAQKMSSFIAILEKVKCIC